MKIPDGILLIWERRGSPLDQTKEALTAAIQEKHIKRAVLIFGIPSLELTQNANARATFARARNYGCSLLEKLRLDWNYVTNSENFNTEASLTYFFPWVYNGVDFEPKKIAENLKIRKESKDANASSKKVAGYMDISERDMRIPVVVFDYNTAAENNTKKVNFGKFLIRLIRIRGYVQTLSGKWSRSYGCEYAKSARMILLHMVQTIILRSTIKSLVYAVSTVLIIMILIW